jgi:hypothetical protein
MQFTPANPMRGRLASAPVVLVAGVALGWGTQLMQRALSGDPAVLANSGVVWITIAFALGYMLRSPAQAAFGGAAALVAASFSYYLAADAAAGFGFTLRSPVIWSAVGVVAGATFGAAGYVARQQDQYRPIAWAALAGAVLGEGTDLVWLVGNASLRPAGLVEIALAVSAGAILSVRFRSATRVLATQVGVAAATLVAFQLINGVFALS